MLRISYSMLTTTAGPPNARGLALVALTVCLFLGIACKASPGTEPSSEFVPSFTRPLPDFSAVRAIHASDTGPIELDVRRRCTPDRITVGIEQGSITLEVLGAVGQSCYLNYGIEIESPDEYGEVHNRCRIPTSTGRLELRVGTNVDTFSIAKFCESNKTWPYAN